MLVLSRKSRESVVIGGTDGFHQMLKVTVLGIEGGRVRLGFEADASVSVRREEVWRKVRTRDETGSLLDDVAATVD